MGHPHTKAWNKMIARTLGVQGQEEGPVSASLLQRKLAHCLTLQGTRSQAVPSASFAGKSLISYISVTHSWIYKSG